MKHDAHLLQGFHLGLVGLPVEQGFPMREYTPDGGQAGLDVLELLRGWWCGRSGCLSPSHASGIIVSERATTSSFFSAPGISGPLPFPSCPPGLSSLM